MYEQAFEARVPIRDRAGAVASAVLTCRVSFPNQGARECRIALVAPDVAATAAAEDFFEALCRVREQLEPSGRQLLCYGASLDVYPSGMMRDMGVGLRAYRLRLGHRTGPDDLVDVLETGPDIKPATVKEQAAYYRRCIASVR